MNDGPIISKTRKEKKWYALYTAPRAEKKVEERLSLQNYEVFLPKYIAKRKWSDRIKEVELPLFTSYIFIRCFEHQLQAVRNVYGVVGVVIYDKKPAVLRESEIEAIRDFLKIADQNKVISEGDMVRILGGSFDHQSGKVVKLTDKYYYLHIESLAATICVEISHVEKIIKNKIE